MLTASKLLSGSTIVSSRTLTIYSATIVLIRTTNTKLEDVPAVSWLSKGETNPYWIVLLILLFMSVSHYLNWWHDISSSKALTKLEHFRNVSKGTADVENPFQYLMDNIDNDPMRNHDELSEEMKEKLENNPGYQFFTKLGFKMQHPPHSAAEEAAVAIQKSATTIKMITHGLHFWVPVLTSIAAYIAIAKNLYF